jgi:hypothetical protein
MYFVRNKDGMIRTRAMTNLNEGLVQSVSTWVTSCHKNNREPKNKEKLKMKKKNPWRTFLKNTKNKTVTERIPGWTCTTIPFGSEGRNDKKIEKLKKDRMTVCENPISCASRGNHPVRINMNKMTIHKMEIIPEPTIYSSFLRFFLVWLILDIKKPAKVWLVCYENPLFQATKLRVNITQCYI